MNFLFDNNLPAALARALGELSKPEVDVVRVVHLSDLFTPAMPDVDWLTELPRHGSPWYVVSIDKFRKSRGAEREALRRAGHTVYVLDAQWSPHTFWLKSAQLVKWWPLVLQHARLTRGGVYRIPWRHSSAGRFTGI